MALLKPFSSSNTHAPEGQRETDHQQAALLEQAGGTTLLNELAFRREQADNWTGGWRNFPSYTRLRAGAVTGIRWTALASATPLSSGP
jgi:hypothetical protein